MNSQFSGFMLQKKGGEESVLAMCDGTQSHERPWHATDTVRCSLLFILCNSIINNYIMQQIYTTFYKNNNLVFELYRRYTFPFA